MFKLKLQRSRIYDDSSLIARGQQKNILSIIFKLSSLVHQKRTFTLVPPRVLHAALNISTGPVYLRDIRAMLAVPAVKVPAGAAAEGALW